MMWAPCSITPGPKLAKKGCDLLMCNDVSGGKVFGQANNRGFLLARNGAIINIADGSKHVVAAQILDVIEALNQADLPD